MSQARVRRTQSVTAAMQAEVSMRTASKERVTRREREQAA
jgi:hypothetical protein